MKKTNLCLYYSYKRVYTTRIKRRKINIHPTYKKNLSCMFFYSMCLFEGKKIFYIWTFKIVIFEFNKNDVVRIYVCAIQSNLPVFSVSVPKNVNRPSKKIKNINQTIVLKINTPFCEYTLMHPSNQLFYSMRCKGDLLCLYTNVANQLMHGHG